MRQTVIRADMAAVALFLFTAVYPSSGIAEVSLEVTYPAGKSPQVFTEGWVFGAKCIADGKDISDSVAWSGTAVFHPQVGAASRPVFHQPGQNTIILSVYFDGETISKEFTVTAVRTDNYAALGDLSQCAADAHGCRACPHVTVGPIISGSPNVTVRGLPAARVGDNGIAVACCGPNTFKIVEGDPNVLIDGKPAARAGDKTQHCGGVGKILLSTIVSNSGYYAVFQLTMPQLKESRKVKRNKEEGESLTEFKDRRRAVYQGLTYGDFEFEDLPAEKSPFIIRVLDSAQAIYPRDNFVNGSKWSIAMDATFYDEKKGTGRVNGVLLLTAMETYESRDSLFAAYPVLKDSKDLKIIEFTDNDGKTETKDEKSSMVVGQITPDWTERDKQEAVQLVKAAMLWFDCFIAHVVYNYGQEEKINRFRKFRDTVMRKTESGSHLVRLYYEYGPYYAHKLRTRPESARYVRLLCDLIAVGLNNVDTNNPIVRDKLNKLIIWTDRIVSMYYTEGASAGPGQITRLLVPLMWEDKN